jgi:uncharacterized protein YjiS (DUF1127 family)
MTRRKNMNAWYTQMDPKFGLHVSAFVPGRTSGGALGSVTGRDVQRPAADSWLTRVGAFFARRALARELVSLDDRLLADIGVTREQISTMVDRLDTRWTKRSALRAEWVKLAA